MRSAPNVYAKDHAMAGRVRAAGARLHAWLQLCFLNDVPDNWRAMTPEGERIIQQMVEQNKEIKKRLDKAKATTMGISIAVAADDASTCMANLWKEHYEPCPSAPIDKRTNPFCHCQTTHGVGGCFVNLADFKKIAKVVRPMLHQTINPKTLPAWAAFPSRGGC